MRDLTSIHRQTHLQLFRYGRKSFAVCSLHHHMHEKKDPITSLLIFSLSSERCQALVGSLQVAHPGCIAGYNMVRSDCLALHPLPVLRPRSRVEIATKQ